MSYRIGGWSLGSAGGGASGGTVGDITAVVAGFGLSGGGASGSVTLDVVDPPTFSALTLTEGNVTGPAGASHTSIAGGGFTNQPAGDTIDLVSDNAADIAVQVTILGELAGADASENVMLNGLTPVTSVGTYDRILALAVSSGAALGTITASETSGGLTITTIALPDTSAGLETFGALDAHDRVLNVVASGATTKVVGIGGYAVGGGTQREPVTLSGTATVPTVATWDSAVQVYVGDLEVTRTITVSSISGFYLTAGASTVTADATGKVTAPGGFVGNLTGNATTVTTNANLTGPITSTGNATAVASQTGTGSKFVMDTSPTLVTPILGVAAATSINKTAITAPATSSTLAVADGKTLTASNTLTLAGTDGTTMTFPTTSATIARTDAANSFTGVQSMTSPVLTTPSLGVAAATSLTTSAAAAFPTVAGVATVGFGVSAVIATVQLTGQTGTIGSTNIVASAPAGVYTFAQTIVSNTAGTAGTVTGTLGFTDPNSTSGTVAYTTGAATLGTINSSVSNGVRVIWVAASTAITYATTVTGGGGGSTYDMAIVLTRVL